MTFTVPPPTLLLGDSIEVLAGLPDASVAAIITDPPYGLEFMGKDWDRFRLDDPGTNRHRGDRAADHGGNLRRSALGLAGGPGGGARSKSARCTGCGRRDQFRKDHPCADGARWVEIILDPYAAPPAALAFGEWTRRWALEALRVLTPGGHLLAFGGSRTYHRLAAGLEDAGFEIRDQLQWLYGSGFPKSMDLSKALDRRGGTLADFTEFRDAVLEAMDELNITRARLTEALGNEMASHYLTRGQQPAVPNLRDYLIIRDLCELGDRFDAVFQPPAERETIGHKDTASYTFAPGAGETSEPVTLPVTAPATDTAAEWAGWGTALKPAHEPIAMARKPFTGTVAANVLEWGTGALNIDATRIPVDPEDPVNTAEYHGKPNRVFGVYADQHAEKVRAMAPPDGGRWPANVLLDPAAALELDQQSGIVGGGRFTNGGAAYDEDGRGAVFTGGHFRGDSTAGMPTLPRGGASRFFYVAKASTAEREAGLEHLPPRLSGMSGGAQTALNRGEDTYHQDPGAIGLNRIRGVRNPHPTVKPIELMRYLIRLVTPPGGAVLDPFMGSGTTGIAAHLEGRPFIGIELDPDYLEVARARIDHWSRQLTLPL